MQWNCSLFELWGSVRSVFYQMVAFILYLTRIDSIRFKSHLFVVFFFAFYQSVIHWHHHLFQFQQFLQMLINFPVKSACFSSCHWLCVSSPPSLWSFLLLLTISDLLLSSHFLILWILLFPMIYMNRLPWIHFCDLCVVGKFWEWIWLVSTVLHL